MSNHKAHKRISVPDVMARKGQAPVVVLTCYSAPMARLLDPHVDVLLVGDSLGMALYGMDTTLGVTLDMMINHGRAVMRGSDQAAVIIDMPFGSYEESPEAAFRNAARVMAETGAAGVKLEGGVTMFETIRFLTSRGIPVMGHVGLRPQSVNMLGGYKAQGRTEAEWEPIIADAKAVEAAGAFSVVIEGVAEPLGRRITEELDIVTIGIGASPHCDGQVLVTEDMLGYFDFKPKFVRRFADMDKAVDAAVKAYAAAVKDRSFPAAEHLYTMKN
jgi:3-methyl-2-oxobutanoate hydroxymethyltransferase